MSRPSFITYIATATPNPSIAALPWPASSELTPIPEAQPITAVRTGIDPLRARQVVAQAKRTTPSLSSSLVSVDSLVDFLLQFSLGLRMRSRIEGDGNCWWSTVCDLISHMGLNAPTNPTMLRKMVVDTLPAHPMRLNWAQALYKGKLSAFNRFVKEQRKPGTWTDMGGIIVVATADFLGVTFHIAGDENCTKNSRNPILVVEGQRKSEDRANVVLHVGYYQNQHFTSLEAIPSKAVPCCGIEEVVEEEMGLEDNMGGMEMEMVEQNMETDDIVSKLRNEEALLRMQLKNKDAVESSLQRIRKFESKILAKHLFDTQITEVLYNQVRELYGVETLAGRQTRRILKKIVEIGLNSCDVDNDESLPDITIVADEEEEPVQRKKTFGALFGKKRKNDSLILAQAGSQGRIVSELETMIPEPEIFSTAVPEEMNQFLQQDNLEVESLPLADNHSVLQLTYVNHAVEQIKNVPKKRKRMNR